MSRTYEAIRDYEGVFVFDADLAEDALKVEKEKVENLISSHQGTIKTNDLWGRRQLAYPIKKKDFGVYAYYVFQGDTTLVQDIERTSRINEAILRFLVVEKDKNAPDLNEQARNFLTGAVPERRGFDRGGRGSDRGRGDRRRDSDDGDSDSDDSEETSDE